MARTQKCGKCGGTGAYGVSGGECWRCGGTGWVKVQSTAEILVCHIERLTYTDEADVVAEDVRLARTLKPAAVEQLLAMIETKRPALRDRDVETREAFAVRRAARRAQFAKPPDAE